MATKIFCDVPGCGREMTRGLVEVPIKVGDATPTLKVAASAGDICKYCMIDAFKKLDDRKDQHRTSIAAKPAPYQPTDNMARAGAAAAAAAAAAPPYSDYSITARKVWMAMYDEWSKPLPWS